MTRTNKRATAMALATVMVVTIFGCVHTVRSEEDRKQRETLEIVKTEATAQIAEAVTLKLSEPVSEPIRAAYTDFDLEGLNIVGGTKEDESGSESEKQPEDPGAGEDNPAEHEADSGSGSEAELLTEEVSGGTDDVSGDFTESAEYWESQEEPVVTEEVVEDYDLEDTRSMGGGDDGASDADGEPTAEPYLGSEYGELSTGDDGGNTGNDEDSGSVGEIEPEYAGVDQGSADDYVEEPVEEYVEEHAEEETYSNYLGVWRITAYCNCEICCGSWAYGPTSSGVMPSSWWTVACNDLADGTRVQIGDLGVFEVQDSGVPWGCLDIYVGDHGSALDFGLHYMDVWIVG